MPSYIYLTNPGDHPISLSIRQLGPTDAYNDMYHLLVNEVAPGSSRVKVMQVDRSGRVGTGVHIGMAELVMHSLPIREFLGSLQILLSEQGPNVVPLKNYMQFALRVPAASQQRFVSDYERHDVQFRTGNNSTITCSAQGQKTVGFDDVEITVYVKANRMVAQSEQINPSQFTPVLLFEKTQLSSQYRQGDPYQLFQIRGASRLVVNFMVPNAVRDYGKGSAYLHLNHCGTAADSIIKMTINSAILRSGYKDLPRASFGVQTFEIPYSALRMEDANQLEIMLSSDSSGYYCLSDVSFSFEDAHQCREYSRACHASAVPAGMLYNSTTITDAHRKGNPYLLFSQSSSSCLIVFAIPGNFRNLNQGTLTISLNHCAAGVRGKVDMYLNGSAYRLAYGDAPNESFGVQNFEIPFSALRLGSDPNYFEIRLSCSASGAQAQYWLSDVTLEYRTILPEVTRAGYDNYVKNWVLEHRSNIRELEAVPRDDMSAFDFMLNAPSWFYLPFLPISPTELGVLIKSFPVRFAWVGWEVRGMNQKARAFHPELLSTDLARKNALRHSYWTALLTRQYGALFADDLSNAHEYAHVDLTIEGPFDHVTDKINNAVGIELAKNDKSTPCEVLIEKAWDQGRLAWAKNFRTENGRQQADIYWQMPLNKLANDFNVIPDFNSVELETLKRMGVLVPAKRPIHDEL
ncbi:DUF6973 domain-containing protein [Micromonospora sp. NPDC018662]|uniref:DUF6973 domain-containing protein n=1 Tax=Micromonospora sp. NPDC018662 TaxID=3364238 RepID=UPI0037903856